MYFFQVDWPLLKKLLEVTRVTRVTDCQPRTATVRQQATTSKMAADKASSAGFSDMPHLRLLGWISMLF